MADRYIKSFQSKAESWYESVLRKIKEKDRKQFMQIVHQRGTDDIDKILHPNFQLPSMHQINKVIGKKK